MKKILMPMQAAGAGHKMPAMAVKGAIDELFPNQYRVEVVDFLQELDFETDKKMKETWDFALAHPFWARVGYNIFKYGFPLSRYIFDMMYPILNKNGVDYLKNYDPDIIFSTHFWSVRVILKAKKKLNHRAKVITYVTDPFDGHCLWAEPEVDYILCASQVAKDQLIGYGVAAEKVKIFQFPVDNKFFAIKKSKEELREAYGLNPNYKTILATAGGQGISDISKYVQMMYEKGYEFNILYVTGKNAQLFEELSRLAATPSKTKLVPLGFVSNMNELLYLSDFTIAKAGASTTFEALFLGNPVIFTHWATYPEKPNIDFCVDNNVGWYASNEAQFFSVIDAIQTSDILQTYQENLSTLNLKSGTNDIAKFVVEQLEATK
ncbi:MAG: hypothetical protein KU37_07570 [Sulfuricurvum sp. PC08-66]|nr:MAG: hypothetical protein KU37_07570 [Sulfuricurvum sp. PC08-66]